MPEVEGKKTFPKIPARNWWELRKALQAKPTVTVNADYLQSVLGLGEGAAKNVHPQLKAIGLIDDSGKLTQLGHDWRDNDNYADVCTRIIESVYPDGLRDALPPPAPDRAATESWFRRNAGVGDAAAKQMASFYLLLADGNPNPSRQVPKPTKEGLPAKPSAHRRSSSRRQEEQKDTGPSKKSNGHEDEPFAPAVSVAVQVYIPQEATPEQIDAIFASMAKHFGRR